MSTALTISAPGWTQVPAPEVGAPARMFIRGSCRAIVSLDGPEKLWHLSISCPHRYPKWDEIKQALYDLIPDEVTMAMLLPPRSEYVNIHPNCFHLHELREPQGIIL